MSSSCFLALLVGFDNPGADHIVVVANFVLDTRIHLHDLLCIHLHGHPHVHRVCCSLLVDSNWVGVVHRLVGGKLGVEAPEIVAGTVAVVVSDRIDCIQAGD